MLTKHLLPELCELFNDFFLLLFFCHVLVEEGLVFIGEHLVEGLEDANLLDEGSVLDRVDDHYYFDII